MTQVPNVSVIIPFRSQEPWLLAAVESVRNQTISVLEVIIICDGCGCDLSRLAAVDARIRIVTIENRGPGGARNLGIELARGEYVAFLDADDVWEPSKIESQLQSMVQAGADWSHTSYSTFRDGEQSGQTLATIHSGRRHRGRIYPALLSSCSIATPTVMIRAALLREDPSLRFAHSMRFGEDGYLWARIAVGHDVLGLDSALTKVRIRGGNAALNPSIQLRARADLWREILNDPEGFPHHDISRLAAFAFRTCALASAVLGRMMRRNMSEPIHRGVAFVLYAVPWCCFRLDGWIAQSRTME